MLLYEYILQSISTSKSIWNYKASTGETGGGYKFPCHMSVYLYVRLSIRTACHLNSCYTISRIFTNLADMKYSILRCTWKEIIEIILFVQFWKRCDLCCVSDPPEGKPFMSYSTHTYITGSTVTLSCSITEDGNPRATWTWRCGSRTFKSGITNSVGRSNLTFVVKKADNNQPCTCTASSSVGPYSEISDPATLDIRCK